MALKMRKRGLNRGKKRIVLNLRLFHLSGLLMFLRNSVENKKLGTLRTRRVIRFVVCLIFRLHYQYEMKR